MFSGIIEATGRVLAIDEAGGIERVRVGVPRGWEFRAGASISVDGICSTVTACRSGYVEVEYMPETRSKTTADSFRVGMIVNLERSMRLGEPVDGHFVAGHVDARAFVAKIEARGSETDISVSLPRALLRFAAPQGSIAINGVALTVALIKGAVVTVALIPHTSAHTNLGQLKKGDEVNVEVDLLARYVAALLKK